jgi:acyl dehydratase
MIQLGQGKYWDELKVGDRFKSWGRTITDADIVNFVNATGMLEVLFTDAEFRAKSSAIPGRVAPAALIYSVAEGMLFVTLIQGTGLAFLNAEIDVKGPVVAGDTVHVEVEVTDVRPTRKNDGRGLVRTRNEVINQRGEVVLVYTPLRLVKGMGETEK